jgi:hypothetical protein
MIDSSAAPPIIHFTTTKPMTHYDPSTTPSPILSSHAWFSFFFFFAVLGLELRVYTLSHEPTFFKNSFLFFIFVVYRLELRAYT